VSRNLAIGSPSPRPRLALPVATRTVAPPSRPRPQTKMATLERPRAAASVQEDAQMTDFEPTAVPAPFPERQQLVANDGEPARGRSAVPAPSHRALAGSGQQTTSQSPGGSTRSISRAVVDRVKRAMSASRDRQAESSERGRRLSDSPSTPALSRSIISGRMNFVADCALLTLQVSKLRTTSRAVDHRFLLSGRVRSREGRPRPDKGSKQCRNSTSTTTELSLRVSTPYRNRSPVPRRAGAPPSAERSFRQGAAAPAT
jgi:hypothetical protein